MRSYGTIAKHVKRQGFTFQWSVAQAKKGPFPSCISRRSTLLHPSGAFVDEPRAERRLFGIGC